MTVWPEDYGRIVLEEVGSTLDTALEVARSHNAPFWLLAHRQSKARARRGRGWSMPAGNFAATLYLRPEEPPGRMALRSFVMSLALLQALRSVSAGQGRLALKWPNDVLLNEGKLAGILLESAGGPAAGLAIGVGVNLVAAPAVSEVEEGALRPVSLDGETSVRVGAEVFLDVLAAHYAPLEHQFRSEGFEPIRQAWLQHAARRGQRIEARSLRQTLSGVFEDVDADGRLVLGGADGVQRIAAADIYF